MTAAREAARLFGVYAELAYTFSLQTSNGPEASGRDSTRATRSCDGTGAGLEPPLPERRR